MSKIQSQIVRGKKERKGEKEGRVHKQIFRYKMSFLSFMSPDWTNLENADLMF